VAGFYNTSNTLTQTTLRKDNVIPIFWGAFRVDKIYDQTILSINITKLVFVQYLPVA
jgi:hypothetical protein